MNYSISQRNKVKRVPDRGHYDQQTVYSILDEGKICHISFSQDGQPFIIPTIYGRIGNKLFFHGATTSRLVQHLEAGIPVSLCVTHLDGLVLARSAFHHSMNYRSVVVFGTAKLVDKERKNTALKAISDQVLAHRWEEVRLPSPKELKATSVLEMKIEQASAKIRTGGPKDDKADYDLPIWAGVIPCTFAFGEPEDDELLQDDIARPGSVSSFCK